MQGQRDALADRLYRETYATRDNEAYRIAKTREITDWLKVQKLDDSETVYDLTQRWFWDPTLQNLCIPTDFA